MPPTQTLHISHTFNGGWATDFGHLVRTPPRGVGQAIADFSVPFARKAENVFWTLSGGFKKIGGTTTLSTQLGSGAEIYGLYDYWKIGTTGSATNRKIAHVSTVVMEDQGADTWQNLKTGLEDGKHPNYCTFNDLLIWSSTGNTDVPQSWDQSTQQDLAGSPPNFAFCVEHKNRVWAAGAVANPSRLYYCVADNPEDWAGSGSGYIDISPGDGDEITGLASYKNELWVFKGPNKGSIHRITGSTPVDFARTTFIKGLAAVGHSTISPFRDDLIFMTPSGSIRSLKATASFGDYYDAALTFPIDSWLITNLNKSKLKEAWIVNDPTNSRLYIPVPTGSSATNNNTLVMDYQFARLQQGDRWSRITDWDTQSMALFRVSGLPTILAGGSDGYVRNIDTADKSIDGSTKISTSVRTPSLNYGSSSQMKTLMQYGVTVIPQGEDDLTVKWERDKKYAHEVSTSQGLTTGAALGVFALGVDSLADESGVVREVFVDTEEGGEFRWVDYAFENDTINDDLQLEGFSTGVQFGAFGTEEP